jgi:hypothetical protein
MKLNTASIRPNGHLKSKWSGNCDFSKNKQGIASKATNFARTVVALSAKTEKAICSVA